MDEGNNPHFDSIDRGKDPFVPVFAMKRITCICKSEREIVGERLFYRRGKIQKGVKMSL